MSDLISRDALKEATKELYKETPDGIVRFGIEKVYDLIDNAPTVTDHSVELVQKSIELGRRVGRAEEAFENQRPQGELAEKLNERIVESVCRYCRMNKHCELCEISRVFQIITLTAEEQKGGAE